MLLFEQCKAVCSISISIRITLVNSVNSVLAVNSAVLPASLMVFLISPALGIVIFLNIGLW